MRFLGRENVKSQTNVKKKKVGTPTTSSVGEEAARFPASSPSSATLAVRNVREYVNSASVTERPSGEPSAGFSGPELQNATSTTVHDSTSPPCPSSTLDRAKCASTDPAEWSVSDVMDYLTSVDSALGVHAQLFQKHVMTPFVSAHHLPVVDLTDSSPTFCRKSTGRRFCC